MDYDEREPIICPDCGGTGSHPWKNSFCTRCNGTGEIEDDANDRRYKIARCRVASGCFEF